jgi:hypothetical protein
MPTTIKAIRIVFIFGIMAHVARCESDGTQRRVSPPKYQQG